MEKTKRGTHQKITVSFSTGAPNPPLPPAHRAYLCSLSKSKRDLTFQKTKHDLVINDLPFQTNKQFDSRKKNRP
jgi:hypothetical protein